MKAKPPSPSLATNRSRQASPRRMNCRMGSASTNSLASTISGPSGTASSAAYQRSGAPASLRVLRCASTMTGLVSIRRHGDAVEEFRNAAPGAESVGHQSAAPRSKLGDGHARRLAHGLPHRDRPKADQLAEDLADLGRRDEVALAADRLAGGIDARSLIGEAGLHEFFDVRGPSLAMRAWSLAASEASDTGSRASALIAVRWPALLARGGSARGQAGSWE